MVEIAAVVLMACDDLIQGSAAQMEANGRCPHVHIREQGV
jgi:hypothetical protein